MPSHKSQNRAALMEKAPNIHRDCEEAAVSWGVFTGSAGLQLENNSWHHTGKVKLIFKKSNLKNFYHLFPRTRIHSTGTHRARGVLHTPR